VKWVVLLVGALALALFLASRSDAPPPVPRPAPPVPSRPAPPATRERRHAADPPLDVPPARPVVATVAAQHVVQESPRQFLGKWTAEDIRRRFEDLHPESGHVRFAVYASSSRYFGSIARHVVQSCRNSRPQES
jgi:hypothetical protein